MDHVQPTDAASQADGAHEELAVLKAQDPEGHGQNIRITPASVTIGVVSLVVVIALAAAITWAVAGEAAARLILGGSIVVAVLLAIPIGGFLVLRSNTHRDLERKAKSIHEAPGNPAPRRGVRKWSRIRAFRRKEQKATVEDQQRMDDDGGPVVDLPRVQD